MVEALLTSKGQVTIPAEVRKKLSLKPGDHLLFEVEGDAIVVRVLPARRLTDLYAALPVERPLLKVADVRRDVGRKLAKRGKGGKP